MSIKRRDVVKTASAAGLGLLANAAVSETSRAAKAPVLGKQAIADRMAFGAWINDVRTEPLPFFEKCRCALLRTQNNLTGETFT